MATLSDLNALKDTDVHLILEGDAAILTGLLKRVTNQDNRWAIGQRLFDPDKVKYIWPYGRRIVGSVEKLRVEDENLILIVQLTEAIFPKQMSTLHVGTFSNLSIGILFKPLHPAEVYAGTTELSALVEGVAPGVAASNGPSFIGQPVTVEPA